MKNWEVGFGVEGYLVDVVLSAHTATRTVIYAESYESAMYLASQQFGVENIIRLVALEDAGQQVTDTGAKTNFWKDRLRKLIKRGTGTRKQFQSVEDRFNAQYDQYEGERRSRILAGINAAKARNELNKLSQGGDE